MPEPATLSVTPSVTTERPPRGREERLLAGWCVYGACSRRAEGWPDPTHNFCARHRAKEQARVRKAKRKARAALADAGKCVRCRKPSKTYRCPACRLLDGCDLPTLSVTAGVTTDKIAAATRKHADGRVRYHGQGKRGQQPKSQLIAQDLRYARNGIESAAAGYALMETDEIRAMPRIQREDVARAADHQLLRAIGHLEEALDRRGHFKQRHGRGNGDS